MRVMEVYLVPIRCHLYVFVGDGSSERGSGVQDFPPRHGIVRGISYMTGYHVISTVNDPNENGCEVTYLTQSDPKGALLTYVAIYSAAMF